MVFRLNVYNCYKILLVTVLLFFISCNQERPSEVKKENNHEVRAFQVKDSLGSFIGWGYDIYLDNNKIIHQPIIPAIEGMKSFKTKEDALKIGNFSISKIQNKNNGLPTISIIELDSLKILR